MKKFLIVFTISFCVLFSSKIFAEGLSRGCYFTEPHRVCLNFSRIYYECWTGGQFMSPMPLYEDMVVEIIEKQFSNKSEAEKKCITKLYMGLCKIAWMDGAKGKPNISDKVNQICDRELGK